MSYLSQVSPKTISQLQAMRDAQEKITVLTAYDSSFARLFDQVGIDVLLVGDSLGNVIQGHSSTTPVTVEDLAYHVECVRRATQHAFLIADMPFASFSTPELAMDNAAYLMRSGAQMVKIEGGAWLCETVRFLVERSVPVCAHLGLLPQSVHMQGGYKVQGKTDSAVKQLIEDAKSLEQAGAQLLVLEAIPAKVGQAVTQAVSIPTIGIGAGAQCSGQVLVMHDMLGISGNKLPKFVKNFLSESGSVENAVKAYIDAVKSGNFPGPEHCFN